MITIIIALFIISLVTFHALEHGFRLKKDMNSTSPKFKLYDHLFHSFSALHVGIWILAVYLTALTSDQYVLTNYWRYVLCFTLLRFGIFDLIVNSCNLDNRSINYLRKDNWAYKLVSKTIFWKQDVSQSIWYFKFMATVATLLWLFFH